MGKQKVLFLCVHNSARSQMAEELLRKVAADKFEIESAGLEPGTINPLVAKVLKEDDGLDISKKETKDVFSLFKSGKLYHYVITVCSKEAEARCPIFPGVRERFNWGLPDPSAFEGTEEEKLAKIREVRDEIKKLVAEFVTKYGNH